MCAHKSTKQPHSRGVPVIESRWLRYTIENRN